MRRWCGERRQRADDSGMTLAELVVTFTVALLILGTTIAVFNVMSATSHSSRALTFSEESAHGAMRVLESDVASADPLVVVPASFTADPQGSSNAGPDGTTPTDIIAMQEASDPYSPCASAASSTTTSTSTSTVLSSLYSSTVALANVIWAYDPASGVLTRYSWCASSSTWMAGVTLSGLHDPGATMFQLVQPAGSTLSQSTTPSSTVVANQSSPACGTSLRITLDFDGKADPIAFTVGTSVQMPNQSQDLLQACG